MQIFKSFTGAALIFAAMFSTAESSEIDPIFIAMRTKPKVTLLTQKERESLIYYDVKLEKLCDADSLNAKASAWVDGAQKTWPILVFVPTETRAVVFTATISFPGSSKTAVAVPLIAYANSGATGKIDCNDIVVTDVPADQVIAVQFDFSSKSQWRFNDPTETLKAISDVGSALGALKATVGAVVFSYVTSNTATFANLTKATNTLLASFDVSNAPRPQSRRFEISASRMMFNTARVEQFGVAKVPKLSIMQIGNGSGLFAGSTIATDFNKAFPGTGLDTIASNVQSNIPNGWTTQVPAFCNAFRATLRNTTQGDTVAVILALYYHAKNNDYVYRNAGGNCLTRTEIGVLQKTLGYTTPPYDLAYQQPLDGLLIARPATPPAGGAGATKVSVRETARTIRVANAAARAVEIKAQRLQRVASNLAGGLTVR